jgi:hypothetical protein
MKRTNVATVAVLIAFVFAGTLGTLALRSP